VYRKTERLPRLFATGFATGAFEIRSTKSPGVPLDETVIFFAANYANYANDFEKQAL